MDESFGARLRQQREKRDVSLTAIAERTKIKQALLEGLERDDISRWPPGIFRRAYVRDYAQAIGLNPDTVMREFLEVFPEPQEAVEPPRPRGIVGTFGSFSLRRRQPAVAAPPHETAPSPPAAAPPPPLEPLAADIPPAGPAPAPPATPEAVPAALSEPALDFLAAAQLCTALGRVETTAQMQPLLAEAARILDAKGLIVWLWDSIAGELRPVLAHGYPKKMLSHLPGLSRDADNVTAAAFRTAETLALDATHTESGALVVPLLTPAACAGVLAIELPHGSEQAGSVRAVATFIAAMLAQLVGAGPSSESAAPASTEARHQPA
jgi:transcriptional regulator with XRE-family HTH domain